MNKVIVSDGQTLLDIALQELGTVEAAFNLADANGLTITTALAAGQSLTVPVSAAASAELATYYASRGHRVNTGSGLLDSIITPPPPAGASDFHHPDFHTPDFN